VTRSIKPRQRKVRILATLGPASSSPEMIRRLSEAGADAFRINMSHGGQQDKAALVTAIRALEEEQGRPSTILFDLQGPKLRVGNFEGRSAMLAPGASFRFDRDEAPGNAERVELPHPELFEVVSAGNRLLIDDGKIRLRVTSVSSERIETIVEVGGKVSDHKGVNVPDVLVPIPALTEKTRATWPSRWTRARTGSLCRSYSGPRTSPRRAPSSATARLCSRKSRSRRRSSGSTVFWSWPTR
jgi:pyruvate kinase